MTFKNPIIGGNDTLVRAAMQSEGFATGDEGWRITREGDAEFNSLVVNGQISAGDSLLVVGTLGVNGKIVMASEGQWILRGTVVAPTLAAGWSNFGGGFADVGYVEMPEGFVQLLGVAAGTPPGTIFTIPAGLRPAATQGPFICAGNVGRQAQIVINTSGTVAVQNADAGTTWVSLAGCRYPIDGF